MDYTIKQIEEKYNLQFTNRVYFPKIQEIAKDLVLLAGDAQVKQIFFDMKPTFTQKVTTNQEIKETQNA
jgi:hypothetical protein